MMSLIHRERRHPQFWLRTLSALTVVVSLALAIWFSQRRANSDPCRLPPVPIQNYVPDVLGSFESLAARQKYRDFSYRPDGWHPYMITDGQLADVATLTFLEELSLADTCVSGRGIRHLVTLQRLRVLHLPRTKISDAALAHVAHLRRLEMLDLDGTYVTDKGIFHLAALDALRVLRLGKTKVSDAALAHLSKLAALEDLYLNNDAVGDEGLSHLAGLTKLEYLDLRATRVTDEGLKTLRQFPALEIVRLDGCAISDAGIQHLTSLKSLELVDLYDAKRVTADGVKRLKKIRPDLTVCWQHARETRTPARLTTDH